MSLKHQGFLAFLEDQESLEDQGSLAFLESSQLLLAAESLQQVPEIDFRLYLQLGSNKNQIPWELDPKA